MKYLVITAIVAVVGYLAWQNFPGLRDKVTQAANQYGGWTEEARQNDPVGFIQHARTELEGDIAEFEKAQSELAKMRTDNEGKLEEFRNQQENSTTLAGQFRELYKTAEETDGWPVTMLGEEYTRELLRGQVEELLTSKAEAIKRQADYQAILDKIELKHGELRGRISDSRMAVSDLEAQESMMKVDTLTAEADEMLAKVNALVEGNAKLASDPIRTTQELLDEIGKQAKADAKESEGSTELDNFLNG